ncbi:short chain dehydrogenase/reductase, putative [Bodo saltans]|uniref:Short chain dehydrogenase/reductase, putative n=1 Tax=Bodo saltans TaxID=75058 RepID=A0A0S4J9K8_BODSA|nr:short chain dehydrogenase/reductase, putative [Bodo saltans]|eukprot:CUG86607.1 short chain dehydrogenase/reductase, putative [Bodo saltans]
MSSSIVVLVTGGSRGIGRAVCLELARAPNVSVAFTFNRSQDEANDVLQQLTQFSGADNNRKHSAHRCDVGDDAQCRTLVAAVVAEHGRLDALVNNAGIAEEHDLGNNEVSLEHFMVTMRKIMDVNFFGASSLTFQAVRQFQLQSSSTSSTLNSASTTATSASSSFSTAAGRIVNITSRAAYRGEHTAPGYASSKAALSIFGQSLARRLGKDNIAIFSVAPGWVETEMAKDAVYGPGGAEVLAQHPLGRIAQPEEVANQVAYLVLQAPLAMTGTTVL